MSHMCEIALVLRHEDYKRLKESAEALGYSTLARLLINPKMRIYNDTGDTYTLNSSSINWNEADKEIIFFRKFLSDHRHSFVRIGDGIKDTEFDVLPEDEAGEDYEFYNLLDVETKIIPAPGFITLKKRKQRKEIK